MTGEKVPRGKRSTAPISKEAPDPITTSESVNKEIGESGIVASMLTRSSDELNLPTQTQQPTGELKKKKKKNICIDIHYIENTQVEITVN